MEAIEESALSSGRVGAFMSPSVFEMFGIKRSLSLLLLEGSSGVFSAYAFFIGIDLSEFA